MSVLGHNSGDAYGHMCRVHVDVSQLMMISGWSGGLIQT